MLSLFKSKKKASLSSLVVDIHNHLLPGIDDGAQTIDHTLGMLRKFEELGYQKLIFTPHVMSGVYNNTPEIILRKLEEVRKLINEIKLNLSVDASAEYYLDDTFLQLIKENKLLPFHNNHILFECSFRDEPQLLEIAIFELQAKQYQPVIAHLERYFYYHRSIEKAQQLRNMGVLIQVNLLSFTGHYGPEVKKQAELLLKNDLIDIVSSDCHRIEHLHIIERNLHLPAFSTLVDRSLRNKSFF